MIEIQNLKFAYEDMANPLLNGVDLTLDRGCWLALVGSNGGGKSTLARMVNGLLQPDSGRVLVDGLCTANEEELWQIRERVAFLFQNPDHQFIATSVEDDVAFGLENLGLAPQEIRRRVEQALTEMDLQELRCKEPHLLSGGEKQRVALAGALAMSSTYLVLDEPTSMLDPAMRCTVLQILNRLHREKQLGMLFVTHIAEEILLADEVAVLEQGRVIRRCTPAELFADAPWMEAHGLELPQICQISAALAAAGYSEFSGVMDGKALTEKILCPR